MSTNSVSDMDIMNRVFKMSENPDELSKLSLNDLKHFVRQLKSDSKLKPEYKDDKDKLLGLYQRGLDILNRFLEADKEVPRVILGLWMEITNRFTEVMEFEHAKTAAKSGVEMIVKWKITGLLEKYGKKIGELYYLLALAQYKVEGEIAAFLSLEEAVKWDPGNCKYNFCKTELREMCRMHYYEARQYANNTRFPLYSEYEYFYYKKD